MNYGEGTSVSDPILQNVTPPRGTTGLRDPSLIRSADGDRFYLLATDLKTYEDGQSWSYRQSRGSRNLVIYESDDLINWSEPRFVEVEDEHAGNVWAPEAFYDPNLGQDHRESACRYARGMAWLPRRCRSEHIQGGRRSRPAGCGGRRQYCTAPSAESASAICSLHAAKPCW